MAADGAPPARAGRGAGAEIGLGLTLTAVAGYVDAIGVLALGGLFASFMSGASVSLGIAASEGVWTMAGEAILLIATFVAGATAAVVMAGVTGAWALPTVLLFEGVLLAGAVALAMQGWAESDAILAVVAAMGVQNTALKPYNGMRLGVTFMTGTLVSLSQALGAALLGRAGRWAWSAHGAVWLAFACGAGLGGYFYFTHGFQAVAGVAGLLPVLALAALVGVVVKRRRERCAA